MVYVSHVQWSDSEEQALLPAPEQQGQCASGEAVSSGKNVNISITPKNDADGASNLLVEKLEGIRQRLYKSWSIMDGKGWKLIRSKPLK